MSYVWFEAVMSQAQKCDALRHELVAALNDYANPDDAVKPALEFVKAKRRLEKLRAKFRTQK